MFEIVVKIAHRIKPLLHRYSKGLLYYAFFDAVCNYQNQQRLFLYVCILHNADYVPPPFSVAIFILSTAYFPYADGVRCR
jgi:hypothetical protein